MLNDFRAEHVYIACGYTDLRYGIDGLAGIVKQQFNLDPFYTEGIVSFLRKTHRQDKGTVVGRGWLPASVQET